MPSTEFSPTSHLHDSSLHLNPKSQFRAWILHTHWHKFLSHRLILFLLHSASPSSMHTQSQKLSSKRCQEGHFFGKQAHTQAVWLLITTCVAFSRSRTATEIFSSFATAQYPIPERETFEYSTINNWNAIQSFLRSKGQCLRGCASVTIRHAKQKQT